MLDRPLCQMCYDDGAKDVEAVALVPTENTTGRGPKYQWELVCDGCVECWEHNNDTDNLPEPVYLEAEEYDREDDPEEVKVQAENTPCPKCGKLPQVQQHHEGLGVYHKCKEYSILFEPGDVNFTGYAPEWIQFCKGYKGK